MISAYDDFGVRPEQLGRDERSENAVLAMHRFFVGKASIDDLDHEALVRSVNPGPGFELRLNDAAFLAEGGFGPELNAPSAKVEAAFLEYAQTELGAVAVARLLAWDGQYIRAGWREPGGALTEAGIQAYGEGRWRPFGVASSGTEPDTVRPSGLLVVPDELERGFYSTGDIEDPFAVLHHEIKAHVLPLKEAAGLVPGLEMELICVRLESEVLMELGLPQRRLNWGRDDGFRNHTLHERHERYYQGLVRYEGNDLVEVDPERGTVLGEARAGNVSQHP